jgi:hypothetical protein
LTDHVRPLRLHDPDGLAGMRTGQPSPIGTRITRLAPDGFPATVIVRDWLAGDTRRCRLCSHCGANHAKATCTIVAIGLDVLPHEAATFDTGQLPMHR